MSCNHIIIQSFTYHEDASLALWALLIAPSDSIKAVVRRSVRLVGRYGKLSDLKLFSVLLSRNISIIVLSLQSGSWKLIDEWKC